MTETVSRIRDLLTEVAQTHHRVFRITDGTDSDWASWYADWLITLSELPDLVGRKPVRSRLVYQLVRLDDEYTSATRGEPWEDYYARALVSDLGATGPSEPA